MAIDEKTIDAGSGADAQLAYAQSALLVSAIVERHSIGALNSLLSDLGRGIPFEQAFASRMFQPWPVFISRFASDLGLPYDGAR